MKNWFIALGFLIVWCSSAVSQNLRGEIFDSERNEPLIGVNVSLVDENRGVTTELDGTFEIKNLSGGEYRIRITYIGYEPIEIVHNVNESGYDLGKIDLVPADLRLEEVVISATPVGSGVRYQAAQVFSGELLRQKSDMSLGVMLDGEPGISMSSFGPAPARPVIRGFDGERVLVLENGERMGDLSGTAHDHVVALEPFATERIEIVRGPSSLLYGSSAIGGVINMMTSDIPFYWEKGFEGRISVQGATANDMIGGFGKLSHGWDNSAVTGRFSYRNADQMRTPEGKLPGTEMENYEGSVGFALRGNNYQGGGAFMFMDMVYGIPESLDDPSQFIEVRLNKQMGQARINAEFDGFFDELEFRFHGGRFFQEEIEAEILNDGSVDEVVEIEFTHWSLSSSVTLQHRPFAFFDRGALGLNVYGRTIDVDGEDAFTPGDQNLNVALFTFQEIPLSSKLRLQFGIRGEGWSLSTRENAFFPGLDESRSGINFSGSTGLNYQPIDGLELGLQLARAYRNPSLEELFANGPHLGAGSFEIGDTELDNEVSYGADGFISWRTEKLHIEAAGFFNHIDNYIIFNSTGEIDEESELPIFTYLDDQAQMMGGEFNVAYQITPKFLLTSGLDFVLGDRTGNIEEPLPFIPPLRWKSGLKWDTGRYWVAGNIRLVSEQDRIATEEEATPGYTLFGFEGGVKLDQDGKHSVVVKAQNITDESYRDHLSRIRERNNPMPGRNFSLSYHFIF